MVSREQFKEPYNKMKNLIEKQKMTQTEVADILKMNRSTFNLKINRTNGRDFSLEEAKGIAELLNVKMDNFF